MEDRDLPSDSDSNDEDYAPEGADNESVSEDSSANENNDQEEYEGGFGEEKKRKKHPSRRKSRKKLKSKEVKKHSQEEEQEEEKPELSAEGKKQKADALWADFLKDCDPPVRRKQDVSEAKLERNDKAAKLIVETKVVEEFHFAGEKVLIEKKKTSNGTVSPNNAQPSTPLPARGKGRPRGGIASLIGQLGKKNKLSTLEKSKLDWDTFKKAEGIEAEIEQHNKGKNGFLERQDFLERSDLRQFEVEKSLRAAKRSSLR